LDSLAEKHIEIQVARQAETLTYAVTQHINPLNTQTRVSAESWTSHVGQQIGPLGDSQTAQEQSQLV